MSKLATRIADWAGRNLPKREDMEHSRWVGPLARRHELWRFTRRSVPRGVAVGLLIGIFALIPGIQIVGAALMCVPCRGNIPLAAAMTFLSNPATTPLIIAASIFVGNKLGYHADLETFQSLTAHDATVQQWAYWLLSDAAPAMFAGLFVISVVTAAIGYLVASFSWSWWIRHKRRVALLRMQAERLES
ncbi:DUF2062 domain-containing protein [Novosphingobium sp.]|uniref:DUF2062 domain-containing protein n=1 Tax=Novosphingobium sp. TaxID=1874826 RepID=UPI0035B17C08